MFRTRWRVLVNGNGHGFVEVFSTPQGWEVHNRRCSEAQPPVMHLTPHAGLRKIFFDQSFMSFLPIMRNISE
jgi:hypothetical protein